ncbi:antA/AntB antirepressor family protein [Flexithrix dorotheae]|uniref:antA/AntB antirepressor family protein n=1 Tax=Flexithrix dorotheae TaxID=70993 RepID=UPI0003798658|nr:antA/AntB antirepressor family protein [Flexithrix dorotheae]
MELIKIYQGNLINARDLHEYLGSKKDFSSWVKARINKYQFTENEDYTLAHPDRGGSWGGSNKVDYILTINMAKELAMVENTDRGREARKYFIEVEKTLIQLKESKRFAAFNKLETTKQKFKETINQLGLTDQDFVQIDLEGRKVFFNGHLVEDEQLNLVLLTSRDLATQITHYNTVKNELTTKDQISEENKKTHSEVRETLQKSGINPEELPPENDIMKLN